MKRSLLKVQRRLIIQFQLGRVFLTLSYSATSLVASSGHYICHHSVGKIADQLSKKIEQVITYPTIVI